MLLTTVSQKVVDIHEHVPAATTNLSLEDKIEAVELSLSKIGLLEYIKFQKKTTKSA